MIKLLSTRKLGLEFEFWVYYDKNKTLKNLLCEFVKFILFV